MHGPDLPPMTPMCLERQVGAGLWSTLFCNFLQIVCTLLQFIPKCSLPVPLVCVLVPCVFPYAEVLPVGAAGGLVMANHQDHVPNPPDPPPPPPTLSAGGQKVGSAHAKIASKRGCHEREALRLSQRGSNGTSPPPPPTARPDCAQSVSP